MADKIPEPNIGNARAIRQIDTPGGGTVIAWRMNADGAGVVDVLRSVAGRQARLRMAEAEATKAATEDPSGWALFDLLRSRAEGAPGFAFDAGDASALVGAVGLAVAALREDTAEMQRERKATEEAAARVAELEAERAKAVEGET